VFADPNPDAAQVEQALTRIRRSGVLGAIAERARAHVDAAMAAMESLAPSPYRAALEALALGLVDRPA